MARTFFRVLTDVEKLSEDKSSGLSKETVSVINSVVAFVEKGAYTNSEVDKFIVSNFRLGATKITKKWNETHLTRQKKTNTFCGQMSLLSSYISSMFRVTPDEFSDAVSNNDMTTLNEIYSIVSLYDISNVDVSNRFKVLNSFLPEQSTSGTYSLSECEKELEVLRTFDIEVITKLLEGVDYDKLLFLINLCKKPLISDEYIELVDKKKKVKVARVDDEKLEFCKVLKATRPIKIKPEKELTVTTTEFVEPLEEPASPTTSIPYKLDINQAMSDIISVYLKSYDNYAKTHVGSDKYLLSANEETNKRAEVFLKCLTVDGVKVRLGQLNPYSLNEAIKRSYMK